MLLEKLTSDFGGGYLLAGSMIKEVAESSRSQLALAGKMMGLCAYGSVIDHHVEPFKDFYFDRDYKKLAEKSDAPFHIGITEAGGLRAGTVKSSIGLGYLLLNLQDRKLCTSYFSYVLQLTFLL